MEREFRGKSKRGIWHYGDLTHTSCDREPCIREYSRNDACSVWVIPETVGRFSRLADKSGKEIYEGDILRVQDIEPLAVVRFGKYGSPQDKEKWHLGFYLEWTDGGRHWYRQDIVYFVENGEAEIVGNIHDNPELLTERKTDNEI